MWIKYRMFAVAENKVRRRRITSFFMLDILPSVLLQMTFQVCSEILEEFFYFVVVKMHTM